MARQIITDDTDSKIRYLGQGWFLDDTGSRDGIGSFGPTYLHTLHGTSRNGTLSYVFEGTSVLARGTVDLPKMQTAGFDFSWECFVDKINIGLASPVGFAANNWDLCEKHGLKAGSHELLIEVSTSNQTFWIDYILHTPSPAFPPESVVVVVENNDPQINYSADWQMLGDGNMTQTNGSIAKFSFTGTSLSWVGFVPIEFPHSSSFATYSIDGGLSTSFQLNGLPPGTSDTLFHQTFFTTPKLQPGPHDLLVTHRGTSQQTPLTIDYLHVTINSTSGVGSTPGSASQTVQKETPTGIIVGVVVGGITVISLCLFLLRLYGKRRAKPYLEGGNDDKSSYVLSVHPFLPYPTSPQQAAHKSSQSRLRTSAPLNNSTRTEQDTLPPPPTPASSSHSSPTILTEANPPSILRQQRPLIPSTASSELLGQAEDTTIIAQRSQHYQEIGAAQLDIHRRVLHQDSGWRLREENVTSIEDVPPHYTAT